MRGLVLVVIGLLMITEAGAQGIYDVSKISPDLLKDASMVVRYESVTYEVKDPGNAVYDYKTAVTLLNKNAESSSEMHEFYDKFSSIHNLKATLYDGKGNKVKEYKSSDFKDRSAVSSGTLYDDSRVKFLDFLYTSFPYTIEYSYSVDFNGIRSYPSWRPISSWDTSVEKSEFTFKIPETMTFKYLKSTGLKTDSLKVKDKIQYKWSCENVKALEYEPMSAGISNVSPWVTLAPNQLEYDNSKANIENWTNLGAWIYDLSNGAQVLPEALKLKVRDLIKGAASQKDKIKVLYNYLQSNTRYVGVQLGIGGYKPIAAEKVAAVNYGDCKALSNYMKALLQEAGIKSNLVVIGNDMPSLNKKFASLNQANHMILCVPQEKDTTWLECTSQFVPAGYIGNDNSDRTVLLITESGGKLAQTPYYSPANNYQKRITKVNLDEEGSAVISIETQYGYARYEGKLGMTLLEPVEQRKKLMNSLSIPNMHIDGFSFNQPNKEVAVLNEKIDLKASQLLTKGGDKLFITLNLTNRQENVVTPIENRKTYFNVEYGYSDDDEIVYNIPKGYKVEFMPKDIVIESEFGKYAAKVVQKDNSLVYSRTKMINNKKYPPEKYNDYVAFSKKIYQADKQKGIFAKIE